MVVAGSVDMFSNAYFTLAGFETASGNKCAADHLQCITPETAVHVLECTVRSSAWLTCLDAVKISATAMSMASF